MDVFINTLIYCLVCLFGRGECKAALHKKQPIELEKKFRMIVAMYRQARETLTSTGIL
jgi:hypothetical protein